jgi:hypothetical protein
MTETTNYGYQKPLDDDFYEIEQYNQTLDKIDKNIHDVESPVYDDLTGIVQQLSSGEKITAAFSKIKLAIGNLIAHLTDYNNPHKVDKNQVGLGNVDNTADSTKSVANAVKATKDASGNVLTSTYATALSIIGKTVQLKAKDGTLLAEAQTQDTTYAEATSSTSGLITGAEKTKLAGVDTAINVAYANANGYTDTKIANLINGAPTTLDTLKEIADAMAQDESVVQSLNDAIGTKANQLELDTHTGNNTIHITASERNAWNTKQGAVTMDTDTSSNVSPGYDGTFTAVDSVTKDANGHVTKVNLKTVKMPTGQTDISGNAGTASKLKTSRTLDGVPFDGSSDITHYAICHTDGATRTKVATLINPDGSVNNANMLIMNGFRVTVYFDYGNNVDYPDMTLNGATSKQIMLYGVVPTIKGYKTWSSGDVVDFIFVNGNWIICGIPTSRLGTVVDYALGALNLNPSNALGSAYYGRPWAVMKDLESQIPVGCNLNFGVTAASYYAVVGRLEGAYGSFIVSSYGTGSVWHVYKNNGVWYYEQFATNGVANA